jgi:predicted transcriptional regulator
VVFIAELSSRRVQGKDMEDTFVSMGIDEVSRKGIDPGHNPNSYPMTDANCHSSSVAISLNGLDPRVVFLENDPADHRGMLSWLAQREDETLSEAGSYGYLVRVAFGPEAVRKALSERKIVVRLAVDKADARSGGLAVYGEEFGRYPVDQTIVIKTRSR